MSANDGKSSSRVIGVYPEHVTDVRGTLVITIGGLHGNEPAGVEAARRVLDRLRATRPSMNGALVSLAGNIAALRCGLRFMEEDLNRVWTEQRLQELRGANLSTLTHERREQAELLARIEELLRQGWDDVVLLDLHSTSADGAPFTIMADTLQNREAAFGLGIPVLLGLEERVDGTLLSYMSERGYTALCVEGGQNDLDSTVDNHETAIWITLARRGLIAETDVPALPERRRGLRGIAAGLPRVVEVRHRHPVPPGGRFHMEPGYSNFRKVERDELLATVMRGEVTERLRTPMEGLLIMPRYQGQGDDAFFIGRRVRRLWLGVSAGLRRMRLEWALPLMPGIRRHPTRARALCVDRRVARWLFREVLHLFGYRKSMSTRNAPEPVFVRRRDAL